MWSWGCQKQTIAGGSSSWERWCSQFLQRSKKAAPDEEEPSVEADDQNQADDDGERAADTAIAAYGGREMGEIVALVKRRLTAAKRWDEVLARTAKKGKKDKEGGDNAEEGQGLEMLLRQDERLEALWSTLPARAARH